jgi:threonine aldolase
MQMIDLRSDTVSWPTPAMREAMANAPVGDDVFGDDPTVIQLEAEGAAMMGKEAGLFVASGTMGNLTAALTHCGRGDEMIVGRSNHMVVSEAGSAAAYGGIQPYMLDVAPDGTMNLDAIRASIRKPDDHFPTTRLICLENTHGKMSGAPISAAYTAQVGEIAREHELKLHIDGARIFNAATALNTPVKILVEPADSVMFCLSKGLCAPVGSLLVGSEDFIRRARRIRKSLGGGMRQVGILAAAGVISLREMTTRLGEDHANARLLAEGLAAIPYVKIDLERVKTNMVFFNLTDDSPLNAAQMCERLKADYNILTYPMGERLFRMVTHYYITREGVEQTLDAIRTLLGVGVQVAK